MAKQMERASLTEAMCRKGTLRKQLQMKGRI